MGSVLDGRERPWERVMSSREREALEKQHEEEIERTRKFLDHMLKKAGGEYP